MMVQYYLTYSTFLQSKVVWQIRPLDNVAVAIYVRFAHLGPDADHLRIQLDEAGGYIIQHYFPPTHQDPTSRNDILGLSTLDR